MKCLRCKQVPKITATSRRHKTGLTRGLCDRCYSWAHYNKCLDEVGLPSAGLPVRPVGDIQEGKDGYLNIKTADEGIIPHHRYVMQERLGRKLFPGETVHHMNGKRNDNRSENLELWFSPQPYGQRVTDLISYIVEHHREDLLAVLK